MIVVQVIKLIHHHQFGKTFSKFFFNINYQIIGQKLALYSTMELFFFTSFIAQKTSYIITVETGRVNTKPLKNGKTLNPSIDVC
jgi:hypothetical protein